MSSPSPDLDLYTSSSAYKTDALDSDYKYFGHRSSDLSKDYVDSSRYKSDYDSKYKSDYVTGMTASSCPQS